MSQGQEVWDISFQSDSGDNIFSTACYDAVRIFDIRHQPSNPSYLTYKSVHFVPFIHFILKNPEPVLEIVFQNSKKGEVITQESATFSPSNQNEIAIACDNGMAVLDIRQSSHSYE